MAIARISLGLATILNAIEMFNLLTRISAGRVAIPVLAWMPAPTRGGAAVYLVAAVAAGAAIAIGYKTTAAAVVSTLAERNGFSCGINRRTAVTAGWLCSSLRASSSLAPTPRGRGRARDAPRISPSWCRGGLSY